MRPGANGLRGKTRFPWGNGKLTPAHANLDGYALGCVDVAAHPAGDNAWGVRQLKEPLKYRMFGMLLTFGVMLLSALAILVLYFLQCSFMLII